MWEVKTTKKLEKALSSLPRNVYDALRLLMIDMSEHGPIRGNWPNYSKLDKNRHHCHIKKGHPTYVAIWVDRPEGIQLIEVTYAGTHERAPY